MVAYSFQKQFIAPILAGRKAQTVRADRKRHARPGEDLQLYSGMRTKHCRLIGTAVCMEIVPIRFELGVRAVTLEGVRCDYPYALAQFARADGFHDWAELRRFWHAQHPGVVDFSGWMIRWRNFVAAPT